MFFLKACARNLGFAAILIFFVARRRTACASKKMIIAAALRLNPKLLFKKNKKNNQQPIPLAPLGGNVEGFCILALFVVWRRLYSCRAFTAKCRFLVYMVFCFGFQLKKKWGFAVCTFSFCPKSIVDCPLARPLTLGCSTILFSTFLRSGWLLLCAFFFCPKSVVDCPLPRPLTLGCSTTLFSTFPICFVRFFSLSSLLCLRPSCPAAFGQAKCGGLWPSGSAAFGQA